MTKQTFMVTDQSVGQIIGPANGWLTDLVMTTPPVYDTTFLACPGAGTRKSAPDFAQARAR